ncbi:uncharacterized protein CANTADRAFT_27162 [Suhomyces tanzawaensis NRRL Y-17324]|uniref:Secreted protein CSS2 C-terminal domain-containing protein n=1 Tax=Suhomyces tanzawaensis NRRL Y-17324 TaxID=984487 RepID=A0A1E4SCM2_9ASCO|nr:uncharacterized protein CANTADRAFT_27162 [Suhomyces tanzawaensis NRRL Y-17324]ODV77270.1 hypothetical protein CANTADRAFT_27162 [Suhomyces tanzawaensis NRRL Y-17324]
MFIKSLVSYLLVLNVALLAATNNSTAKLAGNVGEDSQGLSPDVSLNILNGTLYRGLDVDGGNVNNITKREGIRNYLNTAFNGGIIFESINAAISSWLNTYYLAIKIVKQQSDTHNCGIVQSVTVDNMRYIYSSNGRNCDTTAKAATIEGSLRKAFDTYRKNNYSCVYCMELTYSGAWVGYLLIGPNYNWPDDLTCGDSNGGQCVKGGKNDVVL